MKIFVDDGEDKFIIEKSKLFYDKTDPSFRRILVTVTLDKLRKEKTDDDNKYIIEKATKIFTALTDNYPHNIIIRFKDMNKEKIILNINVGRG